MPAPPDLPCRIVALREADSPVWSFHLVNDGEATFPPVELAAVKYEWGDAYVGGAEPGTRVEGLAPGARALLWHDDGSSEMRTDLWLRVTLGARDAWLLFEVPRLYRQTGTSLVAHPVRVEKPPAGIG